MRKPLIFIRFIAINHLFPVVTDLIDVCHMIVLDYASNFAFEINFSLADVDLLLNIFWYLFRQKHVHQKNSKDKSIINVVALFSVSQPP